MDVCSIRDPDKITWVDESYGTAATPIICRAREGRKTKCQQPFDAGRTFLRGAPLCLVFAAHITVCGAMQGSEWNRIAGIEIDPYMMEAMTAPSGVVCPSTGEAAMQEFRRPPPSPENMEDWEEDDEDADEWLPPEPPNVEAQQWRMPVAVHGFQQHVIYTSVRYETNISTNVFTEEVYQALLLEDEHGLLLVPVNPPPSFYEQIPGV